MWKKRWITRVWLRFRRWYSRGWRRLRSNSDEFMGGHGLTRSVAIKVREIWSVLFSRPSFIPLPFSSVHFFRFLAWKGRSSSPSCSPLFISPLQSSLAQVSAFKMILFFISRFLCTTPPRLRLPPSSPSLLLPPRPLPSSHADLEERK